MKKLIALTIVATLVIGLVFAQSNKAAANWPSKPVQVIVPAGAGGDTDFNARTMAKYFEKITGKSMVITNMNGGGGSIAMSAVDGAARDGSVFFFGHTGQLIVNEVAGLSNFNIDSFDICCIAAIDKGSVLVASKKSGLKDVKDLVARSKAAPGTVIFGIETGSITNLQALQLQKLAGIQLKLVDVGSASEKITSLLGGRIDVSSITYGAVKDYVSTGEMVVLAQFNKQRNALLGNLPTFAEQGVDYAMEKQYVIAFPKGTDPAIVARMAEIQKEITQMPAYEKDLEQGFKQPVDYLGTADAKKFLAGVRTDFLQYSDLMRKKK